MLKFCIYSVCALTLHFDALMQHFLELMQHFFTLKQHFELFLTLISIILHSGKILHVPCDSAECALENLLRCGLVLRIVEVEKFGSKSWVEYSCKDYGFTAGSLLLVIGQPFDHHLDTLVYILRLFSIPL
jgi:hypothetical protein